MEYNDKDNLEKGSHQCFAFHFHSVKNVYIWHSGGKRNLINAQKLCHSKMVNFFTGPQWKEIEAVLCSVGLIPNVVLKCNG